MWRLDISFKLIFDGIKVLNRAYKCASKSFRSNANQHVGVGDWQVGPAQPLAQKQLNPLTSSVQVPPLAQGVERHSSISERGEKVSENSESRSKTITQKGKLL